MSADTLDVENVINDRTVEVPIEGLVLQGRLSVPATATHIVVFAHGSGSSRFSPRNKFVADILNSRHIASLLIDLLSEVEGQEDQQTAHLRFNIPFLSNRLSHITRWVATQEEIRNLKICYFGSSTGAAATLVAAAESIDAIASIVSRGGRPDLAGDYLPQVKSPTLLIVGENDPQVLELNELALAKLNKQSKLSIIAGATHLFEENNCLQRVAHIAADWFKHHDGKSNAIF